MASQQPNGDSFTSMILDTPVNDIYSNIKIAFENTYPQIICPSGTLDITPSHLIYKVTYTNTILHTFIHRYLNKFNDNHEKDEICWLNINQSQFIIKYYTDMDQYYSLFELLNSPTQAEFTTTLNKLVANYYSREYCEYIWDPSIEDPPLVTYYKNYPDTFELIIYLLTNVIYAESLQAGRALKIYKPRPPYITHIDANLINHNTKISLICNNIITIYDKIRSCTDDTPSRISDIEYAIRPYDIESDIYTFCPLSYDMISCAIRNFNRFKLEHYMIPEIRNEESLKIFRVQYNDMNISSQFDKVKGNTLFHGSTALNWYSILFNGIYDGSDSGLLLNGAAHGKGVYLANAFATSYGYSTNKTHITGANSYFKYVYVGVFQLDGDLKTYDKGWCHVVPDSSKLCLRYLIRILNACATRYYSILDNYFTKGTKAAVRSVGEQQLKITKGIGRKQKEMEMIFKSMDDPTIGINYKFDFDEENINKWYIKLLKSNFYDGDKTPSNQCLLWRDMERLHVSDIDMEITLPEDYPISPPFIRIISPRFAFMTGHITSGGSICTELLTKQGWLPAVNILKVLIMIVHNMIEGGARLDPDKLRIPYTFEGAKEAYNRMLTSHGKDWGLKK